MLAPALKLGDTIGIVSPSHVATREKYEKIFAVIEALGFRVKPGKNLYNNTYGYAATEADRIEDFNAMIRDDEVKMVFFGGGEGSIDLLSSIDYDAITENPKLFLAHSDATSILNAIHANTGLTTYYGIAPSHLLKASDAMREAFFAHLVDRNAAELIPQSEWECLHGGRAEGTLIGGFNWNYALLQGSPQYPLPLDRDYILFIEDTERFSTPRMMSMYLSHIMQSRLWPHVKGMIAGYEELTPNEYAEGIFRRIGERYGIPVLRSEDYGHGALHTVLPIGGQVVLDADEKRLIYR